MKRLSVLLLAFALSLALPLAYLVTRAFEGLAAEERAALRVVGEALFDAMEGSLAELLAREQARPVEAYAWRAAGAGPATAAELPPEAFILGYFQNNPDGSFQTPLTDATQRVGPGLGQRFESIVAANQAFNQRRLAAGVEGAPQAAADTTPPVAPVPAPAEARSESEPPLLSLRRAGERREYLGQQDKRLETLSENQVRQLAPRAQPQRVAREAAAPAAAVANAAAPESKQTAPESAASVAADAAGHGTPVARNAKTETRHEAQKSPPSPLPPASSPADRAGQAAPVTAPPPAARSEAASSQVEVAPFQMVWLGAERVFLFRRVLLGNQVFRQGLLIDAPRLLQHLLESHFSHEPLAGVAHLELRVSVGEGAASAQAAGVQSPQPVLTLRRTFPAPFNALRGQLQVAQTRPSESRRALGGMTIALAIVCVAGLLAIWFGTRAAVGLSERRARFVAAVTHELRTPLTSIRLYADMLRGGMASSAEKSETYLGIVSSESERLARLIDNVLDFARLEKGHTAALQSGPLTEAIDAVQHLMAARLEHEGFTLRVSGQIERPVRYDREGLIQALLSIIDNSLKFGRQAARREIVIRLAEVGNHARLSVSDFGPGLAPGEQRKIFRDFYRGGGDISRSTGGTGIGLAMVRRRVAAMGARVWAENNVDAPGCTIVIELPAEG